MSITKLWLPDLLLARGDKMSMAVSLEARVPLLDHKLVEFATSLPQNMKVNGLARKYLLKKVSQRWLPPEIIHRKKQGFPMLSRCGSAMRRAFRARRSLAFGIKATRAFQPRLR